MFRILFSDEMPNLGLNNNTINGKPDPDISPRASPPRPQQQRYQISPASSMHLDRENSPLPQEEKLDEKQADPLDQAEDLSNKASRNGSPNLTTRAPSRNQNRYHPYAHSAELMIKSE